MALADNSEKIILGFNKVTDPATVSGGQYALMGITAARSTDVVASGASAVRFTFGNDSAVTDNINDLYIPFGQTIDFSEASYVSMYIKNESALPIGFRFYVKQVTLNKDNYEAETPAGEHDFWHTYFVTNNSAPTIYQTAHSYSDKALVKGKDATDWTEASTAAAGDSSAAEVLFTLPEGFDGYVKIPLAANEKVSSDGFVLRVVAGYKAAGSTPSYKSYAGKSFVLDNVATDADITISSDADMEYINVINKLDVATSVKRLRSGQYGTMDLKFERVFDVKSSGDSAARITIGNPTDNLNDIYCAFGKEYDLSKASYVTFYMKNEGTLPMGFFFQVKQLVLTVSNYEANTPADEHDFWKKYFADGGADTAYQVKHNDAANPAYVLPYGETEWQQAAVTPTAEKNGGLAPLFTIPGGFDGYVKISLGTNEKISTDGINLRMVAGYTDGNIPSYINYAGMTFVIDDIGALSDTTDTNFATQYSAYLAQAEIDRETVYSEPSSSSTGSSSVTSSTPSSGSITSTVNSTNTDSSSPTTGGTAALLPATVLLIGAAITLIVFKKKR